MYSYIGELLLVAEGGGYMAIPNLVPNLHLTGTHTQDVQPTVFVVVDPPVGTRIEPPQKKSLYRLMTTDVTNSFLEISSVYLLKYKNSNLIQV